MFPFLNFGNINEHAFEKYYNLHTDSGRGFPLSYNYWPCISPVRGSCWLALELKGVHDFLLIPGMSNLINGEVLVAFETFWKAHLNNSHEIFSATGPLFKSSETLFELRRGRCLLDVQNTKAKLMAMLFKT